MCDQRGTGNQTLLPHLEQTLAQRGEQTQLERESEALIRHTRGTLRIELSSVLATSRVLGVIRKVMGLSEFLTKGSETSTELL